MRERPGAAPQRRGVELRGRRAPDDGADGGRGREPSRPTWTRSGVVVIVQRLPSGADRSRMCECVPLLQRVRPIRTGSWTHSTGRGQVAGAARARGDAGDRTARRRAARRPRPARRAARSGRRRRAAPRACPSRRPAPRSRTTICSASRTVESRCAIAIVVRPSARRSSASWTSRSVWVSSAEVASSRTRIGGFRRTVRAIAIRCFSPPGEAVAALADDGLVPVGERGDQLVDLRRPGRLLDLLVGRLRLREAEVLAHGRVEEIGLLRDDADRRGERLERQLAHVDAVDRDRALASRRRAARRGSRTSSCPSRSRRRAPSSCRPAPRTRRPSASTRRRRSGSRRGRRRRRRADARASGCPRRCRSAGRGSRRCGRTAPASSAPRAGRRGGCRSGRTAASAGS